MEGSSAGLAALAFWGFVATLIVAGVWGDARKREAQHETLRRLIESGKPVDQALLDKVLGQSKQSKRLDRDLRVAGIIVLSIVPGVVILGAFLSLGDLSVLIPFLGIAGLLLCIGIGLMAASAYVRRALTEDEQSARGQPGSR